MKLKYRLWQTQGPILPNLPSRFPFDMLRYDPAYIKQSDLEAYRSRLFLPLDFPPCTLVYPLIPGYLSSIMDPCAPRWNSFGWKSPIRIEEGINSGFDYPTANLTQWVGIIGFYSDDSPMLMNLQQWVDAKTMNEWHAMCDKVRYAKR